jgi:aminoglycoside 3-N-acetyltransferase
MSVNSPSPSTPPATAASIAADLAALGVEPGMVLMVHCALKPLGWVLGAQVALVDALMQAIGGTGTLLMPAFNGLNSDPRNWSNPPVDESLWPLIREHIPAFSPATSPGYKMGAVSEYFRTLPAVLRSAHPQVSWAAWGARAAELVDGHSLDYGLGERSPLGRCYDAGAHVLSIGCSATSVLHLAEHRCEWHGRLELVEGAALLVDGQRQWVERREQTDDNADFEALRLAYRAAGGQWREGPVAGGSARLLPVRPLVDFAAEWLPMHRVAT